eukprot:CAMPEP_0197078960 /NCGR_PEP_ID=MMETSP1384-20130603/213384_1 /TAXON_ID=29189 /ORGANISM="Ammonia sp." /LENGTH=484 /DNA_ID=CAMNT_0042517829 /DNA_START=5 /DNA_END=1456 /DNA_ORIENTATION=-
MASPVETGGGEEGTDPLRQCLRDTFNDDEMVNSIYFKLQEQGLSDLETLILGVGEDDSLLQELYAELQLKAGTKIKFNAMIKRQTALLQSKQSQQQTEQVNMIAISVPEQQQLRRLQDTLQRTNEVQKLLQSYTNRVEQDADDTKTKIDEKINEIVEALHQRQAALKSLVDEWKANKLESTNAEIANMQKYAQDIKQCINNINSAIHNDQTISKSRETKVKHTAQKLYDNNADFEVLDDVQALQKYIMAKTKSIGIRWTSPISVDAVSAFGTIDTEELVNEYQVPSITLSDIIETEGSDQGCHLQIAFTVKNFSSSQKALFTVIYAEADDDAKDESVSWTPDEAEVEAVTDERYTVNTKDGFEYNKEYVFKVSMLVSMPLEMVLESNMMKYTVQPSSKRRRRPSVPIQQHAHSMNPLTAEMLGDAKPAEQKRLIGERLFPKIHRVEPRLAGKIVGMLLEMDNTELLVLLSEERALMNKINEALA